MFGLLERNRSLEVMDVDLYEEGFLLDLPGNVLYDMVALLDRRSLGALASTCTRMRGLALSEVAVVRVGVVCSCEHLHAHT